MYLCVCFILEPNANALQLIGFTRKTGPYVIFSKLPQFIHVLLNSFLDQGFMKQVRDTNNSLFIVNINPKTLILNIYLIFNYGLQTKAIISIT